MLPPASRFVPHGAKLPRAALEQLPGLTVHDLMLLPISRSRSFFDSLELPKPLDDATDLLLNEIRTRVAYLCQVGLSYLTLDRQSRTLSGGEVQRINLTTALGTSLVNTLFVLDEPSIGLHPRDMGRVIDVMHKLRDAGNSLVVVEHDPQVMLAADRILDMGPGPGSAAARSSTSATRAAYAARQGRSPPTISRDGGTSITAYVTQARGKARRQRTAHTRSAMRRASLTTWAPASRRRSKCSARPSTTSRTSTSAFR